MDLLQAVGHLLEALTQALLQRRVQLLIHRGPHLLELLLVVLLDGLQALLHRQAQLGQALLVALLQLLQLLAQALRQETLGLLALEQGLQLRGLRRLPLAQHQHDQDNEEGQAGQQEQFSEGHGPIVSGAHAGRSGPHLPGEQARAGP